jgi:hypothetical protein
MFVGRGLSFSLQTQSLSVHEAEASNKKTENRRIEWRRHARIALTFAPAVLSVHHTYPTAPWMREVREVNLPHLEVVKASSISRRHKSW